MQLSSDWQRSLEAGEEDVRTWRLREGAIQTDSTAFSVTPGKSFVLRSPEPVVQETTDKGPYMDASAIRQEQHRQAIAAELRASASTKEQMVDACTGAIVLSIEAIVAAVRKGNKILLCGNGGSAADAQHLATEFVIRMDPSLKRPGIPAIALTTDSSMLTAGSNDLGYESVFSRAVETLGQPDDVLIGISTSGKSESVNRALSTAKVHGMFTIGFLGKGGGRAKDLVDIALIIPSDDTQRVQEGHITAGHIICGLVEHEMYASAG